MRNLGLFLGLLPYSIPGGLPPISSFWNEFVFLILILITLLYSIHNAKEIKFYGVSELTLLSILIFLTQATHPSQELFGLPLNWELTFSIIFILLLSELRLAVIQQQELFSGVAFGLILSQFFNFIYLFSSSYGITIFSHGYLVDNESFGLSRFVGTLRQPNQTAIMAVAGIIAAQYLYRTKLAAIYITHLSALLCSIIISMTGSRVGLLTAGMLTISYFVTSVRKKTIIHFCDLIQPAALALPIVLLSDAIFSIFSVAPFEGVTNRALAGIDNGRIEIWRNALSLISHNIFRGVGLGNFSIASLLQLEYSTTFLNTHQAHNFFLDIFLFFGLPLGIYISYIFLSSLLRATRTMIIAQKSSDKNYMHLVWLKFHFFLLIFIYALFELPHWYIYFLFPFCWLSQSFDRPRYVFSFKKPMVLSKFSINFIFWIVFLTAISISLFYIPIQNYYTKISYQTNSGALTEVQLNDFKFRQYSLPDAVKLNALPWFHNQSNLLVGRAIGLDDFQNTELTLNILKNSLAHSITEYSLSKYIIFLQGFGRSAEACTWFKASAISNGNHSDVLLLLRESAKYNSSTRDFLKICI